MLPALVRCVFAIKWKGLNEMPRLLAAVSGKGSVCQVTLHWSNQSRNRVSRRSERLATDLVLHRRRTKRSRCASCAPPAELEEEIENGTFHRDLFYRINVVNLYVHKYQCPGNIHANWST
jgi:hypothetical protein